ncbi:MAG TPA: hypothetical protein PLB21_06765 [Actinomycetota bacterium]|nr:hypothetical protein [Actinomycetota bacterium]
MRTWRIGVVALAAVVAGCTAPAPGLTGSATPTASPTPSASPSAAPSPTFTGSPLPDSDLPVDFPVTQPLVDGAAGPVVDELHRVAGGLPVLKVDVTTDAATLSALLPDLRVATYQWRDGVITRVDSDVQYFEQATFDPHEYPLESVGRMFDVADLRGVRGELILQIVDYRAGQVLMTVTSRPESETVFFRQDGSAVAVLGVTSVADIAAGVGEVVGQATQAYAVGFNATRGYWADLPDDEDGVVLNRARVGAVPVFETRRTQAVAVPSFDPTLIDPASLAKSVAQFQDTPEQQCDVVIDMSLGRSAPVVRVDCEGGIHYADLEGRDMTDLVG